MPAAIRPSFEGDRLKALHALNIPANAHSVNLDRILQSLAKILSVPITVVSLVTEDKVLFVNSIGISKGSAPSEHAFCAHAILAPNDTLCVPDALEDGRFSDNPLVLGAPYIRSYAAIPLLERSGLPIGALCLIDPKPRFYSDLDLARLRDAGRLVSTSLRLLGAQHHLAKSRGASSDRLHRLDQRTRPIGGEAGRDQSVIISAQ
jgi:GAF domain-containing protein